MNFNLKGKKILLIMPIFYDYHNLIIKQLEDFDAEVFFYPERKINYLFTYYNNYNKKGLRKYQEKHYSDILKDTEDKEIDFLFMIRGFMFPSSFIGQLKKRNPVIKTIMSQWDSNKENPYFHIVNSFDRVFSFDYEDCKVNDKLTYRPLFFTKDIEESRVRNHEIIYDYFFMGAYIPERYNTILKFKKLMKDENLSAKLFIFIPFKTYIKEKLKGKSLDMDILSTNPLDRKTYLNLLSSTRIMVDVSNKKQTGLAMRVIEAFGAGKKIMTNNKFITNEKMYNDTRVALFTPNNLSVDKAFLNSKIKQEKESKYYSLKYWLKEQFIDLV